MWGMARPGLFSRWRSRVHTPASGRCGPVLQPWWLTDTSNQSLSTLRHPHRELDSPSLGAVDFQVHLGIFAYLLEEMLIQTLCQLFCLYQLFVIKLLELSVKSRYKFITRHDLRMFLLFLGLLSLSASLSSLSSSSSSFKAQKFFWWNPVVSVYDSVVCALVSQMSNVLCV